MKAWGAFDLRRAGPSVPTDELQQEPNLGDAGLGCDGSRNPPVVATVGGGIDLCRSLTVPR